MSTFFFLVRNAHFFLAIFQGTVLMCIFFKIGDPGEGSGILEVGGFLYFRHERPNLGSFGPQIVTHKWALELQSPPLGGANLRG